MAKILIIDDDESMSAVFCTALEKNGFQTISTKDGKGGIEKARIENPNLILLDQVLPDISGNQVLKTLKADLQTKDIPIMMLSNFGQEELVKEAINDGAQDYVFKYQVEVQDLVNKVTEVLKSTAPHE
ncbi:MAG: response regulator [Patescibacteria group bacterium]|nr:response regulator [Patescibacteria group bacterium]